MLRMLRMCTKAMLPYFLYLNFLNVYQSNVYEIALQGPSTARRVYLELKTNCQQQRSQLPLPPGERETEREGGEGAEEGGVKVGQTGEDGDDERPADMLAALEAAVLDTVADNVALSRTDKGFCCSFTTRCSGMSARIHVKDSVESGGAVSTEVSCDLFLVGASQRAAALLAAHSSAEQVVKTAFWPALRERGKRVCQDPESVC